MAAASAVAESLPFDKQTTKSELLRQLQQHEKDSRAQKDGVKPKIRLVNQIIMLTMMTSQNKVFSVIHNIFIYIIHMPQSGILAIRF